MTRCFMVAAPHTGAGKTTLATGIMRVLTRRGLVVQGFKTGADYIDSLAHAMATGRYGCNLDTWLMGSDGVRELFAMQTGNVDVAVIEGVMGLFDGGPGGAGSSAELAKLLGVPVVLVVDAWTSAQSIAATALGFSTYDPGLRIAGVIANRVASQRHAQLVAEGMRSAGLPLLGMIPHDERLNNGDLDSETRIRQVAAAIEPHINWARLLEVSGKIPAPSPPRPAKIYAAATAQKYAGLRLAVARDEAFRNYYGDLFRWLDHLGIEAVPFSPLRDTQVPPGVDGMLLGGGPVDKHAAELAANRPMLEAVRSAFEAGVPIYAEGGGYEYLLQDLVDGDKRYHLTGCIAGTIYREPSLQAIGYRIGQVPEGAGSGRHWLPHHVQVRGHVFHFGRPLATNTPPAWHLRHISGEAERHDGVMLENCCAGYLQVHLPTQPALAAAFLDRCRRYQSRKERD